MYNFPEAGSQYIPKINAGNFRNIALELYQFQRHCNPVYRDYLGALGRLQQPVTDISNIPFLPISFFKTHAVSSFPGHKPVLVFESSTTTGDTPGRHPLVHVEVYNTSLLRGFSEVYGPCGQYAILALLPSYLERKNASLVHMARVLMEQSGHPANGFYLHEWEKLAGVLTRLQQQAQPVILLGVSFALLDFAAAFPMPMKEVTVLETGGMKGRRTELTRAEVHQALRAHWPLARLHSEYGMTELLSQAYAADDGFFRCAPTMKVLVRDINDPLDISVTGHGVLNIIDLANVDSCAFIATEDLGRVNEDGSFEVLGRMDHTALRGCSLMAV